MNASFPNLPKWMQIRQLDAMTSRIVWTAVAGAVAGVLTCLGSGVEALPRTVVMGYQFIGAPFALLITATMAAQDSSARWNRATVLRYCAAAIVLAIGPPCAILVGGAVDRTLGVLTPGQGTFGILVPAAAILLWALCLAAYLGIVVRRWKNIWFLQATVLVSAIAGFAVVTNLVAKGGFGPVFIVSEQIGSAIFLAAAAQNSNRAGKHGRMPGTARRPGQ